MIMFSKMISNLIDAGDVYAHCDFMCGVYDPAQARTEAQSVYNAIKLYQNSDDEVFRQRAILIKEERAELTKHHLWVLWTDYFKEEQIFRIDHYLAKDALQNILTFRFANALFENQWNNKNIEKVHIKLYEDFGVEERGSFYDSVGALRDVGQNHLLQMLSIVAMENPGDLTPEKIRDERFHVIDALKSFSKSEVRKFKEVDLVKDA